MCKILNISRPTINKRIEEVMDRVKLMALDYLGHKIELLSKEE